MSGSNFLEIPEVLHVIVLQSYSCFIFMLCIEKVNILHSGIKCIKITTLFLYVDCIITQDCSLYVKAVSFCTVVLPGLGREFYYKCNLLQ